MDIGLVIVLVVAAIIIGVVAFFLIRRLRNSQSSLNDALGPDLDARPDYTSDIPKEPDGWRERFNKLSVAGKILLVMVPVLVILGLVAFILFLRPQSGPPLAPTPTPIPVTLTVSSATVVSPKPLSISVTVKTTGLADGVTVTAELQEDDQPFVWLNPERANGVVRNNQAEISKVERAANAATPTEGRNYTVVVRSPDGTASTPVKLKIPESSGIAVAFYGRPSGTTSPTPTDEPTATVAPVTPGADVTPEPTVVATPTLTATPDSGLPTGPSAGVVNGGNVRRMPIVMTSNVVGGINAGEQVQVIERTPNRAWYRIRTVRDELGWVAAALIRVPAGTQIPVAKVVTVFTSGPMYEQASATSSELGRIDKGDVVELLQRTADGSWYQVVNVRADTGWVEAKLLDHMIPADVAAAVDVAPTP